VVLPEVVAVFKPSRIGSGETHLWKLLAKLQGRPLLGG